jgi:hypothetical protein
MIQSLMPLSLHYYNTIWHSVCVYVCADLLLIIGREIRQFCLLNYLKREYTILPLYIMANISNLMSSIAFKHGFFLSNEILYLFLVFISVHFIYWQVNNMPANKWENYEKTRQSNTFRFIISFLKKSWSACALVSTVGCVEVAFF